MELILALAFGLLLGNNFFDDNSKIASEKQFIQGKKTYQCIKTNELKNDFKTSE